MVTAFSFEDIIILLLLLYYSVNPLGLYQILNTVVYNAFFKSFYCYVSVLFRVYKRRHTLKDYYVLVASCYCVLAQWSPAL